MQQGPQHIHGLHTAGRCLFTRLLRLSCFLFQRGNSAVSMRYAFSSSSYSLILSLSWVTFLRPGALLSGAVLLLLQGNNIIFHVHSSFLPLLYGVQREIANTVILFHDILYMHIILW